MAITNRRYLKDAVIGLGHQTIFGTLSGTTNLMQARADSSSLDPAFEYVQIEGTTGSYFPKDANFKAAERPVANLVFPSTKKILGFLMEHTLHGQPQATQAGAELTIANDGGSYIASLVLNGVRPHLNTDATWKMYVSVTDGGGGTGHTIQVYRDSGKAAGDLVCSGTGDDSQAITLNEANSSGLTGTMTFGTISGNDTDIEITIVKTLMKRSGTIDRYFSLYRDTGRELESIRDCTVQRLVRRSSEAGYVELEVDIVGSVYDHDAATALTPAITSDDNDVYLHNLMTLTGDNDVAQVAHSVMEVELELANDVQVDLNNSGTATGIWKRRVEEMLVRANFRWADESRVIMNRAFSDAFEALKLIDTHTSKNAEWVIDKAKPMAKNPDSDQSEFEAHEIEWRVFEESAASPAEPFTLSIAGP